MSRVRRPRAWRSNPPHPDVSATGTRRSSARPVGVSRCSMATNEVSREHNWYFTPRATISAAARCSPAPAADATRGPPGTRSAPRACGCAPGPPGWRWCRPPRAGRVHGDFEGDGAPGQHAAQGGDAGLRRVGERVDGDPLAVEHRRHLVGRGRRRAGPTSTFTSVSAGANTRLNCRITFASMRSPGADELRRAAARPRDPAHQVLAGTGADAEGEEPRRRQRVAWRVSINSSVLVTSPSVSSRTCRGSPATGGCAARTQARAASPCRPSRRRASHERRRLSHRRIVVGPALGKQRLERACRNRRC